jgi:hypothetical protein
LFLMQLKPQKHQAKRLQILLFLMQLKPQKHQAKRLQILCFPSCSGIASSSAQDCGGRGEGFRACGKRSCSGTMEEAGPALSGGPGSFSW